MPTEPQLGDQSLKLAVIPGDGIGPEVTAEALKVLEAVTPVQVKFEPTRYDLGAERYLATGEVLPDTVLAEIREHDAILLGAVGGRPGDPNLPPGILERGLLLRLRFELDHYVNLRPSRIYPGATSPLSDPGEVDFVVVREGTEGPYVGNGGALRVGTPHEIATEVSVNTAYGVERVVRWGLTLPLAASPMPPVTAAARSVMMSPNRLSVTITSKRAGSVARKIIVASTWR